MESLSEIGRLTKVSSLQKSGPSASLTELQDKCTLSPEGALEEQKRACFVEMLQEMGPVHMHVTGPITQVIARKIYEQHFQK